jgi:hypothetical protein
MFDGTCRTRKIHPEPCYTARPVSSSPPFPLFTARREPAPATGRHPSSGFAAAQARA